jgi:hypothetical protein
LWVKDCDHLSPSHSALPLPRFVKRQKGYSEFIDPATLVFPRNDRITPPTDPSFW